MTVGMSTFVSVVIVFLAIIFVLLVMSRKPTKIESDKMKEAGLQVAEEIKRNAEKYIQQIELQKKEINKKLEQLKQIQYAIQYGKDNPSLSQGETITKSFDQQQEINNLFEEGYSIEQISRILHIQKGMVEVSLNMSRMKV